MRKPFTYTELVDFLSSCPSHEGFGPKSDHPYIAFELENSDTTLKHTIKKLPCPVIGLGTGLLATACDVVLDNEKKLPTLIRNIEKTPLAAMVLVQHLRASETLSLLDCLTAESFAYGTLQQGPEFQVWLKQAKPSSLPPNSEPYVNISIEGTTLSLSLNHPEARNAIGVKMRDTLCEALDLALIDTSFTTLSLTGIGATFSTGGAVEEFGDVSDPATAHWIRTLRLPALKLVQLRHKLNVHVNGAAIGAGAEIASFGHYVTASDKAWFQLPELKYGLIPGAGGTASITRRIGRQKTAYMALTMDKVKADQALEWGLIDAIID